MIKGDTTSSATLLGPWIIYHSGDTIPHGMEEILRQWEIDVALLPINGRLPERRVAGNLKGREAARLAESINAGLIIPCHLKCSSSTPSPR